MNLRDVLRTLNVKFWESGQSPLVTAGWVGIVCGRCGGTSGKPGLGLNLRTLRASCWKCGGQNLAAALAAASGQPFGAVAQLLGGVVAKPVETTRVRNKLELPPGLGPLLPAHRRYLAGRGFDPDALAAKWGVQGIGPHHGILSWRVYIPVYDAAGEQVSWTARAIGDVPHGLRYRSATDAQAVVPRGETLFGENHCRHAAVVCEGHFDAVAVGFGAVATGGVGFSKQQVLKLAQYPVRALCFDSDPAAQRRARDLAAQLSAFDGETHVVRLSGKDPATAPKDEIAELRARFLE